MKDDDDKAVQAIRSVNDDDDKETAVHELQSMNDGDDKQKAAHELRSSITRMRASLTPAEEAFLRGLLLDRNVPVSSLTQASKTLSDEMLFSIPFVEPDTTKQRAKAGRPQHNYIGLWSAFRDGFRPKAMIRKSLKGRKKSSGDELEEIQDNGNEVGQIQEHDDEDSIPSDDEVRPEIKDDQSGGSSLDESDVPPEHYDAWEVLKDEYAKDFGYDYSPNYHMTSEEMDEDDSHSFAILGTSRDDKRAHPHVLSPPLMDSLMAFLPAAIKNQNYWLKYSLVRDGASLAIFRRYIRGAPRSIIALETADGHVFGSFTSTNWRFERSGFFGSGESFLWRMRHSRNSKCASLFDQAQLESEVDVYLNTHDNDMIQLCNERRIAVGGGELESDSESIEQRSTRFGFGLSIDEFMHNGTSSPCATFRNPCLVDGGPKEQHFQIVNLEVWTLTPCVNVQDAERLEMTKFFIHQSTQTLGSKRSAGTKSGNSSRTASMSVDFDGDDFTREKFYRRVGENDESEQQREIWQYANMMDATKNK